MALNVSVKDIMDNTNLYFVIIGLFVGMIILYIIILDYIFLNSSNRPGHQTMAGGGPETDFFTRIMDFLRTFWLTR